MDDYLSKPLDPGALLQKLAELSSAARPVTAPDEDSPGALFDSEQFESLKCHLAPEEVSQYVTLFLEHIVEQLAKMPALACCGDLDGLEAEAHTLVGSAGNIGAMSISNIAGELYAACRDGDRDQALRLAGDLQADIAAAASACQAWLARNHHPLLR